MPVAGTASVINVHPNTVSLPPHMPDGLHGGYLMVTGLTLSLMHDRSIFHESDLRIIKDNNQFLIEPVIQMLAGITSCWEPWSDSSSC